MIGIVDCATMTQFEAKLDQYPKGTTFTLIHQNAPDRSKQRAAEAALPALFEKHGMKLITPDQP